MRLPKLPRKTNRMYSAFGGKVHYCRSTIESRKGGANGRLGIYYGPNLDRDIVGKINIEYHTRKPVYLFGGHVSIDQYADEPVNIGLYLWPFSLYLNIETPVTKWLARRLTKAGAYEDREIAVHVCSGESLGTVRWNFWTPDSMWSAKTPKYRNGSFNIVDFVLGRREMRWEHVSNADVLIPMFEKTYPATVEMRDHVSWRRRLPFLQRRLRCADVDIPGGIGFPGKGENAWDCGDDAIFAMSCPAETPEEAVGKVVASVLRNRRNYGGSYTFEPQGAKS